MNPSTITKKNKRLLLVINLFVFFLITLTTLVSCETCTNTNKDGNKNLGSITTIEVDKPDLIEPGRHFNLKLIVEDDKKTVNLADYELVGTIANGKLKYTSYEGNDRTQTTQEDLSISRELTQFFKSTELEPDANNNGQNNIGFEVVPDPATDQMNIQLELFKKTGDNKKSIGKVQVGWKKGGMPVIEMELVGTTDFVGTQIAQFKLKNKAGISIKPSEINLAIATDNNAEFQFCQQDGTPIVNPATLQDILGNNTAIDVGDETEEIFVKLRKAKGNKVAQVTITVKKDAYNVLATANWQDLNVYLEFVTIDEKIRGSNPIINFTVENRGTHKLEKGKAQVAIIRIDGDKAAIKDATDMTGGAYRFDLNNLELDPQVISNQQSIEILPDTDKKATFTLELLYNGRSVGTQKTVTWVEQDVQLAFELTADKDNIHYKITNNGTDEAKGVTLAYTSQGATIATLGMSSPINIGDIPGKGTKEADLAINWNTSTSGAFRFILHHPLEADKTQTIIINSETPTVKLVLFDLTKTHFLDVDKQVKLQFINTSTKTLDKAALQAVKLVYDKTAGGSLKKKYGDGHHEDVYQKDLWELLQTELGPGAEYARVLDLMIDHEGEAEVKLEHIRLNNSTEKEEIPQITWEGTVLNVAINCPNTQLKSDANKTVEIQITNNSGFKLRQKQLEKLVLNYDKKAKGKLKKGAQDVNGKDLWALLDNNELESGDAKAKTLNLTIDNEGEAKVTFTNIMLQGSTDNKKIDLVKWEK